MSTLKKSSLDIDVATIRFAGDSGDGMQLTGSQFSDNTAIFGNDLATLPDFPAEIRAPKGSLFGVSSFQLQFSNKDIHTPGDDLDVLVAMNPAGLKVHLGDLKDNGMLLVNTANFTAKNLKLAKYEENPLENGSLDGYQLISVDMTNLVTTALKDTGLSSKIMVRCTNMFALGLLYWLYGRSMDSSIEFLQKKFASKPEIVDANIKALNTGYYYGETIEAIKTTYKVNKASFKPGTYRNIMGNNALALGLLTASEKSDLNLFYGGYPITPASDILHYLAQYKQFGVRTFQAEDEIAGITSAIGASFAGNIAVTATSGPGVALKTEALGLAIITELPIVLINVQRGGPSTGLPTKTEQSDLNQAIFGRNGEAPLVVLSAATPSDCFNMAYEACRIALKYMIPVILLTDGYVANGSEPWKLPDLDSLKSIETRLTTQKDDYAPYKHDKDTLARPWAIPGTPDLEHRIGGLEKWDVSGHVSYDPENHQEMVELRQKKVNIIANDLPVVKPFGDSSGDLLVIGWGGTHGAIRSAVELARNSDQSVSHLHLRYLNPLPKKLGDILLKYKKVLIPELNLGQLAMILRSKFLIDIISLSKVQGRPFNKNEILNKINQVLKELN
jgi:2-oxoglutarate ferredoxin oxidoreductase subunit alpha